MIIDRDFLVWAAMMLIMIVALIFV